MEGELVADRLIVKGAREHNLRSVDLDLPRDSLIVFTGLSGSGKSSLAFDTIFAEGSAGTSSHCRRMPVSSWGRWTSRTSTSSRDFHRRCRSIRSPPTATLAPRSAPSPRCTTTCGCSMRAQAHRTARYAGNGSRQTPQQIVDQVFGDAGRHAIPGLGPVVRTRKGEFVDLFDKLNTQGYSRVRVDGVVHSLTDPPKLKKQEKHDIEVVVDRLTVKASAKQRLTVPSRLR